MSRIDRKTLLDLEFPAVLQQMSEYCITELGQKASLRITPFRKQDKILKQLSRVKEFKDSFDSDSAIPNHGFESINKELTLLNIENSQLEISGFRRISSVCQATSDLLVYFKKNEEFYIYLASQAEKISYTKLINEEIHKIIDRYGLVKDDASEDLAEIRKRLFHVKNQINASFNRALQQYQQAGYLDEIKETIVNNRRVLAVSANYRRRVNGSVLGSSKTGSILYIEPQETLEYATELSHLTYEENEEIKRILKALTEYIRPYAGLLKSYQNYLIKIDVIYAKAKYAMAIGGNMPIINKNKQIKLIKAYHPLLLTSNKKLNKPTYPQNFELYKEQRIIVISGPNAGGKSISLKTVGLLQIMLQSGLLVPLDPMSEMCYFKRVLSDIGDNQSIENHLSTYSYRLKKMNQFIRQCNKDTLFLIDEFGTGSDPELGGALAEVFLEVFYEKKAYGIITTHYANLKLLASELPQATNANMLFDNKSLEPLFKLQIGEAGSSFTFEVAQKNGIPYSLINRAKKKVERDKIRYDRSIANLQRERQDLRKTSQSLKTQEQEARKESIELAERNLKVQEKLESYQELYDSNQKYVSLGKRFDKIAEDFFYNKRKRQLNDELFKLVMTENSKRERLARRQKQEKQREERRIEREAQKKIEVIREEKKVIAKKEAEKAKLEKPKVAVKIGDRVRIINGTAIGTLDKIEKGKALVNYGMFTTQIDVNELEKI